MSFEYSEDNLIENATQDVLQDLGWDVKYAWTKETFGENGLLGRENKSEVILRRYVLQALEKLNPGLPFTAYEQAIEQLVIATADKTFAGNNQEKYQLLKDGALVSYTNADGELEKDIFQFVLILLLLECAL